MGYTVKQKDSKFAIRYTNFEPACQALSEMANSRQRLSGIDIKDVLSACRRHDFFAAMRACGWECNGDEEGINKIAYRCETLGYDDLVVLKAIAPFVESGSYIEMLGGDGEKWRWLFKDGDCIEEKAIILFPSEPVYVVTCDWIKDYEGGVTVLGVTRNKKAARRIMQEKIETEKRESWIADIPLEDIGAGKEEAYEESCSEDEWSFFLKGCYCTQHTDFAIHEMTIKREDEDDE